MSLLLESTIKASVILLFALGLMPLLRNRSAALRHWILSAALVCAAAAPVVALLVPSWHLPIGLASNASDVAPHRDAFGVEALVDFGSNNSTRVREVDSRGPGPQTLLGVDATPFGAALHLAWIAGVFLGVAVVLVGLGRLARLAANSRRITEGVWLDRAEDIRREYCFRRPVVLLQSDHPTLLVTWGLLQPKVILPAAAREWREDRIRLVLYHELAHVRRGDWVVQLGAELFRCAYWFNPLVWIACTRLRQESEQACDDTVLNRGIDGSEYATHLVDIARDLQQHRMWMPAPAIARTSSLERRVRAMLDTRLNHRPISPSACIVTLLALLTVTIPIAGFAAAQTTFARVAGTIVDPMNAVLPGVTLVLTNLQSNAKYEVRSDRTGRYEFIGLAPGDYLFEARLPGFAMVQGKLTLAGQNLQQDLTLQIGSLEETVTVRDNDDPAPPGSKLDRSGEQRRSPRPAAACGSTPSGGNPPIGGNIRAPLKLTHVRPEYPAHLRTAGIEGTVVLQGRIGTDGILDELNVVSASHPDLATAAVAAVRQWQWDSTLLNCIPVEVPLKVTVHFQRQ
jgi:TonB family protein